MNASEPVKKEPEAQTSYERDKVMMIINSVMEKIHQADELSRDALHNEVSELKNIIQNIRTEIGQAQPSEIKEKHIPSATDELDAVGETALEATHNIMDACEIIQNEAKDLAPEIVQKIDTQIIRIFEACSFQDITGQRISKVINTLKEIDRKVAIILDHLEYKGLRPEAEGKEADEKSADAKLLNGPQLPSNAITQDDIDKLLAEFDSQ